MPIQKNKSPICPAMTKKNKKCKNYLPYKEFFCHCHTYIYCFECDLPFQDNNIGYLHYINNH